MIITIKNWEKYQTYRPSRPTEGRWKKLHQSFFSDFHVRKLTEIERFRLLAIFAFTDLESGTLEVSGVDELCHMIGCKSILLSKFGHFISYDDSTVNQKGSTVNQKGSQSRVDKSRVDKIRLEKTRLDLFASWWELYPAGGGRKKQIEDCQIKWLELCKDGFDIDLVMEATGKATACREWLEDGGKYIPAPLVWLNQSRWLDDYGDGDVSEGGSNLEGIGL